MSLFKYVDYKPLVLTNSKFSASIARQFLGLKPLVLYPPVDVEKYPIYSSVRDRKRIILTLARLESVKGLHLIPEIAKHVSGESLSSLMPLVHLPIIAFLNLRIRTFGVEDRVIITTNITEELKLELLRKATIYFYPMKYEHFGIAVVEAMAAGLIPVVHKSGGPWIDIVKMGKYGKGFTDVQEVIYAIEELLSLSESELYEFRMQVVSKAKTFNFTRFKELLYKIIDFLLIMKNKNEQIL